MRIFPHALVAVLIAAVGCSADDKKDAPDKKADKPKLGIGDPAPAFAPSSWAKGLPTKIEPGKVYVLEFWATWCAPCIKSMPHLTTLLDEYKDKGLTVIAVTTQDKNGNTLDAVEEFLKKKGDRFPFAFAFCTTDAVNTAFMDASGTDGIPASFVIDTDGKIAFIGHPSDLDDVLPRLFAGTWQGQKSVDEIQKEKDDLDALLNRVPKAAEDAEKEHAGKDSEAIKKAVTDAAAAAAADVLKAFPDYEKKYPIKAGQPLFGAMKIALALQARQFDAAAAQSDAVVKQAVAKKDSATLGQVRKIWLAKNLNPERKLVARAVSAAEEIVKIEGDGEIAVLLAAAEAHYAAGDKAKGKEYGDKAVKLAGDDSRTKEAIEKALTAFQK